MTVWTWAWIAWAAGFAAIEIPAIVNKTPGDTLSEHLRSLFRVRTRPGLWAWRIVSGVFFAWFVIHIAR